MSAKVTGLIAVAVTLAATMISARACDGLEMESGWIREPPPHADVAAAFMRLRNRGATQLRLTKIGSPLFASSMLHETVTDDHGVTRMVMRHAVTIEPGAATLFAPGGLHVMLMKPRQPIEKGLVVPVEITCENGIFHSEIIVKRD
jgi:periplasmic copper chaperone A